VSVSNERCLVSIHSADSAGVRHVARCEHAVKSARYDTYPVRRFRRSQGRFRGNPAAIEVSAGRQEPLRSTKSAMITEVAALHKRSLSETAHTAKMIDVGMAWSIDGTGDVRRLKTC